MTQRARDSHSSGNKERRARLAETFGLEVGAIGAVLLLFSRFPDQGRGMVWTIIGIEIARGIIADIYLLARGSSVTVAVVWLVTHTIIIVTGLRVLRAPVYD